jgi:undecaprenyl-diphosphatase
LTLLYAALLGIIEGITEFLPISSTGHLILSEHLLGIPITDAVKSFDIAIQLGAIAAVLLIYWKILFANWKTFKMVCIAFIPTAVIGLLLHSVIKTYLLGSTNVVVWALLIGGIALILFELNHREEKAKTKCLGEVTVTQALWIGVFQSLALIPGTSRSAATIVGGLILGLDRKTIIDFSFLLAIPTMAAATGLDLLGSASSFTSHDITTIAVGFVFSFITAYFAIKWLLTFIRSHTFIPFGIYRIIIAIAFWMFVS